MRGARSIQRGGSAPGDAARTSPGAGWWRAPRPGTEIAQDGSRGLAETGAASGGSEGLGGRGSAPHVRAELPAPPRLPSQSHRFPASCFHFPSKSLSVSTCIRSFVSHYFP